MMSAAAVVTAAVAVVAASSAAAARARGAAPERLSRPPLAPSTASPSRGYVSAHSEIHKTICKCALATH